MSKLMEQLRARRAVTPTASFLSHLHESAGQVNEGTEVPLNPNGSVDQVEFCKVFEDLVEKKVGVRPKTGFEGGDEFWVYDAKDSGIWSYDFAGDTASVETIVDLFLKKFPKGLKEEVVDPITKGEEKPQVTQGEEQPVQTAGEETLMKGSCPSCGKAICVCGSGEPLKEGCSLKEQEQMTDGEEALYTGTCPHCGKALCVCGTGEPLKEACIKEDEEVPPANGEEQPPENKDAPKKTCYCFEVSDQDGQIKDLIDYIGKTAAPGHSFTVVVDPDNEDTKKEFFIDGDGSDRIGEVCVEECTEEELAERCGKK